MIMKKRSRLFMVADAVYVLMMTLPLVLGMVIKVLTKAPSEGIEITGAQIYFSVPLPLQNLVITEAQLNSLLVMISITGFCLYLTHGLSTVGGLKRQVIAEWIVEKTEGLVKENMGDYFMGFSPFVASIIGLFPPTSDVNITAGWAILVFILITYYKFKAGPVEYVKSFCQPAAMAPLNIISEVATPISMAFRHYGNVLSGSVISVLVATGLQGLSSIVLGWLPGFLGEFPFLQIGIPAVLSVYFDIFSGGLQAYIFAMLTMLYVAGGFPQDAYEMRKLKKAKKIKV